MKRTLNALALLLLLFGTSVATAAPDSDAVRIFDDGRRLFDEGKYTEALRKFEKTLALQDSPNARLYLARTLHELGRNVEAYDEMVLTKEQAEALDHPKYVQTRDIAAARLAIIEKEIGRVIVVLSEQDESIKLTVAGREIPRERLGKMIPVEPGSVAVAATTAAGDEARKQVSVAAGALVTVSLDIGSDYTDEPPAVPAAAPAPAAALAPEPEQAAEEEPSDPSTALTATGIVVASVGVAGMVVFGVAGSMASSKHSSISDECGDLPCPEASYNEQIDEGQTLQTVANVGFGVGVGGLAVGTALIVIGVLSGEPDAAATEGVAVQAGPQGAFFGYSASF